VRSFPAGALTVRDRIGLSLTSPFLLIACGAALLALGRCHYARHGGVAAPLPAAAARPPICRRHPPGSSPSRAPSPADSPRTRDLRRRASVAPSIKVGPPRAVRPLHFSRAVHLQPALGVIDSPLTFRAVGRSIGVPASAHGIAAGPDAGGVRLGQSVLQR
jgi:hypothetical protein